MKTHRLLALCLLLGTLAAHAQGPLAPPPGAPAPNMKTLEQIEPRTLISSLPFSIRDPGSYYLTGDLTGTVGQSGITVDSDDVTIDLNGFTLRGIAGTGSGILVSGTRSNLTVRNGVIRKWSLAGVDSLSAGNSQFVDLLVTDNQAGGLKTGAKSSIRNCQALGNSDEGILVGAESQIKESQASGNRIGIQAGDRCRLEGCQSTNNTGEGVIAGEKAQVLACQASANGLHGITVGADSQVKNCSATLNAQIGIGAGDGSTVDSCVASSNATDGIQLADRCMVRGNTCHQNGLSAFGAGIRITGSENRIESNLLTAADRGLWVTGTKNHISGNTVHANAENYVFSAGNELNLLISEIPETIAWPAKVELAGTLTGISGEHGIRINSSEVTLDLKGHSLAGVAGSLNGIEVINASPDHTNITIRDGTVQGWGGRGVSVVTSETGKIEGLKAASNGLSGIAVGDEWIITDCHAISNLENGIIASDNCHISDCVTTFNTLSGIRVGTVSIIRDCVSQFNSEHGIRAGNDNRIIGNTCDDNDLDGIHITSGDTRVDSNHVTDNTGAGINCISSGCLVIRNTAAGNITSNYLFAANNKHGPIVDVTSTNGDISGVAGSNHPWANFEF